jgi:hypothetical protein
MIDNFHYNKVASILLKQNHPIKLERLSMLSSISISELKEILKYFNLEGFLKHKDNFDKIELTEKAKK